MSTVSCRECRINTSADQLGSTGRLIGFALAGGGVALHRTLPFASERSCLRLSVSDCAPVKTLHVCTCVRRSFLALMTTLQLLAAARAAQAQAVNRRWKRREPQVRHPRSVPGRCR